MMVMVTVKKMVTVIDGDGNGDGLSVGQCISPDYSSNPYHLSVCAIETPSPRFGR